MKYLTAIILLTAIGWATGDLQTAKVVAVKAYERGRVAYWEGRVPVYDDYPVYDITLALDGKKYLVRYESVTGYYPSSWSAGTEIKVRREGKGKFYLLNGSEEVAARVVSAQDCVPVYGSAVRTTSVTQVPCE